MAVESKRGSRRSPSQRRGSSSLPQGGSPSSRQGDSASSRRSPSQHSARSQRAARSAQGTGSANHSRTASRAPAGSKRTLPPRRVPNARSGSLSQLFSATGSMLAGDARSEARDTAARVGISFVSATAGLAGGILLGRRRSGRAAGELAANQRVGSPGLAEHVGEAARQFGRLASELRIVRETAEQIARVLG